VSTPTWPYEGWQPIFRAANEHARQEREGRERLDRLVELWEAIGAIQQNVGTSSAAQILIDATSALQAAGLAAIFGQIQAGLPPAATCDSESILRHLVLCIASAPTKGFGLEAITEEFQLLWAAHGNERASSALWWLSGKVCELLGPKADRQVVAHSAADDVFKRTSDGVGLLRPSDASAQKLGPRHKKAWNAYQQGAEALADGATDRQVHAWLKEQEDNFAGSNVGDDYELPDFATWSTYLRDVRRATGQQKKLPRRGRTSRSIVGPEELGPREDAAAN
jgi:hypothetical protein